MRPNYRYIHADDLADKSNPTNQALCTLSQPVSKALDSFGHDAVYEALLSLYVTITLRHDTTRVSVDHLHRAAAILRDIESKRKIAFVPQPVN